MLFPSVFSLPSSARRFMFSALDMLSSSRQRVNILVKVGFYAIVSPISIMEKRLRDPLPVEQTHQRQ
jgi:hypothetical protein